MKMDWLKEDYKVAKKQKKAPLGDPNAPHKRSKTKKSFGAECCLVHMCCFPPYRLLSALLVFRCIAAECQRTVGCLRPGGHVGHCALPAGAGERASVSHDTHTHTPL